MAEFSWRSRREAAPSSWSSDEPALDGGTVHHHPLPTSVRVLLVVYGLALGVLIITLAVIFVMAQKSDAKDREQLKKDVIAAIEKDNAARLAADARQSEATRKIVCGLVEHDLPRSANTIALAKQLRCGQPAAAPRPSPQTAPRASSAGPPVVIVTVRPQPQPAPHSSSAPRPSPSPTCTVVVLGNCLPPNINKKEKP